MWGQRQIRLSVPKLTAHGWRRGRNGTEGINQNFYVTDGEFLKLYGSKGIG
jgi:hypothetical protein